MHAIAQALWSGKLFHIDLNGQRGIKYDQDLVFGHGDFTNAFFLVDLIERSDYSGPKHFDYKPMRTEDLDGVGVSGGQHANVSDVARSRACFQKTRVQQLRLGLTGGADPDTGETIDDLTFSAEPPSGLDRGYGVQLSQLAVEHLMLLDDINPKVHKYPFYIDRHKVVTQMDLVRRVNRKDVISVSQAHDIRWRSTEAGPVRRERKGKG